jgi:hypothetical protein
VKNLIENQLPISEWVVSIDFSAANYAYAAPGFSIKLKYIEVHQTIIIKILVLVRENMLNEQKIAIVH